VLMGVGVLIFRGCEVRYGIGGISHIQDKVCVNEGFLVTQRILDTA
jgi:hypothetical protein